MAKEKVLIIKLGYSEILVGETGTTVSLGDVLRAIVLLHLYKDADVTWLVDEKAIPLLKGNPYIRRIMPYNLTTVLQLRAEKFDTVINLEKVAGVCALADSLSAWRRYGFRFDPETGEAEAYDGSQHVMKLCLSQEDKASNTKLYEELLFGMVGKRWEGEMPILGYKPKSEEIHDIGFNHNVGEKWPTKAWPPEYWKELEGLIGGKHIVSWQEGTGSIEEYIEWINACRLIVTNDSLGLHIAHALNKKIIALFGPTVSGEVYVKDGVKLLPEGDFSCLPCMDNKCIKGKTCMYSISPERVLAEIERLMSGSNPSSDEDTSDGRRGLIHPHLDFKGMEV